MLVPFSYVPTVTDIGLIAYESEHSIILHLQKGERVTNLSNVLNKTTERILILRRKTSNFQIAEHLFTT